MPLIITHPKLQTSSNKSKSDKVFLTYRLDKSMEKYLQKSTALGRMLPFDENKSAKSRKLLLNLLNNRKNYKIHNMRKLLFSFIFVFTSLSMLGQTSNIDVQVSQLSQRVDSLEHEMSYMRLSYELYTLNTDITVFANEVYIKAIEVQLDIKDRRFDKKMGAAYQKYFEACLNKQQAFSKLIEAKKNLFAVKVITYPYSEKELDTLLASYDVIDDGYATLESSMDVLRITVEGYIKLMKLSF